MIKNLIPIIVLALTITSLSGCNLTRGAEDQRFEMIADKVVLFRTDNDAYRQKNVDDTFLLPNLDEQHLLNIQKTRVGFLTELASINVSNLSADNKINLTILTAQIQNKVDEYKFHSHYMPLTSEYGFHSALTQIIGQHNFKNKEGYLLYLARLEQTPRFFRQNMTWMRKAIELGLTQPKAVLEGYDESIKAFIVKDVTQSPYYAPFKENRTSLSDAEFKALQVRAKKIIKDNVVASYTNYLAFFEHEYFPASRKDIGISSTPNGKEFYINRAKHYTTTQMTPQQIHALGLQEVTRIRSEMQEVIEEVGFKGTFAEFVHFLRTDPQFYATSSEQLIKEASYISKKMDAQLPKLFHTLPRRPYGVEPVPASIAPKYTTGRYIAASKDEDAGYYWVNTYALNKRPLYVLEALTLHEAVPGHHLQIALNAELDYLPSYRKNAYISAFGEGWGLYSEYLGLEAGFYQDPYSNFGRLTYEMWRAVRLVVDTGMHMFGWSREKAINFMKDNTALSLHNVKTETDRYISWPGQALSYKIGELTIKRLRKEAETKLGDKFDIREFHHQILKHGSVPLFVLEDQIRKYIEATRLK